MIRLLMTKEPIWIKKYHKRTALRKEYSIMENLSRPHVIIFLAYDVQEDTNSIVIQKIDDI